MSRFVSIARLRRISLTSWILLASAAGVALGLFAPDLAPRVAFVSVVFLRLIRSIIAPVLVGVLIRAIAGSGSMANLGRLGWKSVVYFEAATTIALLLGWFTVAFWRPGDGLSLPAAETIGTEPLGLIGALENAVPTSIFDAMARGDALQIVIFCFLFGLACLSVGQKARPVVDLAGSLAEVAFRYTDYVMYLAPAAVFAAAANMVAGSSSTALEGLARFVAAAWFAQALFLVLVLGGSLIALGIPLARFARFVREPFLVGFATTSSAAALPQTLENMQRFGVHQRILGVVVPLSLSLNLNGSTIHLGMAALFVAQAAHIDLPFEQQLLILLTLKLTSKGVAGVPRANFVILAALFESFSLPMEGLAVLLGIDAAIDPVRTSVNVVSHCIAPVAVARWEGVTFQSLPDERQETAPAQE
ncbi:MAG: dicarboxylate/amino acid:cation symporter [Acidobacteria bacterium]|nr:dicarboxylate/amino acid:cation symporter [Acidobacteriota bacterium]MDA1236630.1 dicarboxylate/amino acid:cation symporter [Acidobacteriota bacterium]